ncbi:sensor domain-containing protein [Mycobacterium sp. OTB74]|uniref:sensor domain-containing protein n=1 Tax=Mycobacterium sp. OTB74 TaxID=1853452 RepID=UPI002475ACCF|nr:sensor domain-containing protein [Mycobacterium sp. OTB74]MDH6247366.1 hypothetical protein [Mycobacterium sp. OTB74]
MRQPTARLVVAIACLLLTGCTNTIVSAESTATRVFIPRPLVERELDALLVNPDQANAAMGTTGMAVTSNQSAMSDNSTTMAPPECLPLDGAAEAVTYVGSNSRAERDQSMNNGDKFTHYLKQAVVLFLTVDKAQAFFDNAARQWPGCHQYTHLQSQTQWVVGPVSNENGTLSAVTTEQQAAAPGWACERALTLKNNIIADVNTCSANPAGSAVKIAQQIAANIASRW